MKHYVSNQSSLDDKLLQINQFEQDLNRLKFQLKHKTKRDHESDQVKNDSRVQQKDKKLTIKRNMTQVLHQSMVIDEDSFKNNNSLIVENTQTRKLRQYHRPRILSYSRVQQKKNNSVAPQRKKRYVSQFQKDIKEMLSRIPFCNQKYKEQFQPKANYFKNQKDKFIDIGMRNKTQFKQAADRISRSYRQKTQIRQMFNRLESQNISIGLSNHSNLQRVSQKYRESQLRRQKCKTQIKSKQAIELQFINKKNIKVQQKNEQLSEKYSIYESRYKKGDKNALELMSKATIARADLFLKNLN